MLYLTLKAMPVTAQRKKPKNKEKKKRSNII
jgi:hypothetical protein